MLADTDPTLAWTDWESARPTTKGLYWWRVEPRIYGGLTLRPEWVAPLSLCGMGYADSQLWPEFSRWDGRRRTVPAGTQWRPADETAKKGQFVFAGLDLNPCPFCGSSPTFGWHHKSNDGGIFVCSAPYQANSFKVQCGCGLAGSYSRADLKGLVDQWNRRVP